MLAFTEELQRASIGAMSPQKEGSKLAALPAVDNRYNDLYGPDLYTTPFVTSTTTSGFQPIMMNPHLTAKRDLC